MYQYIPWYRFLLVLLSLTFRISKLYFLYFRAPATRGRAEGTRILEVGFEAHGRKFGFFHNNFFIILHNFLLSEKIQLLAVIQSTSSYLLQKSAQIVSNISSANNFLAMPSSLPLSTDLVSLKILSCLMFQNYLCLSLKIFCWSFLFFDIFFRAKLENIEYFFYVLPNLDS